MFKQLGTWIAVGTTLVIGVVASAQQGRWAAQSDETAQSLINMERQWAEANCDGTKPCKQSSQMISKGRLLREHAIQSRKKLRT